MAKRRTKKQKLKTNTRQDAQTASQPDQASENLVFDASLLDDEITTTKPSAKKKELANVDFNYVPAYFKKDLSRTVILSALIIGFEVALYVFKPWG